MSKESICIKVPKHQGQKTIALTSRFGVNDKTLCIRHDEDYLYIPLLRRPKESELEELKKQATELELTTGVFTEKKPQETNLIKILEKQLPSNLLASLPHALDIIGDIAVIEIPQELKIHEEQIGQAILKAHKNVKTVLAKAGAISGTYRLRELAFIAGEQKTQTIHREHCCQFYVDIAKAYFSPRLSHEHERVASLVQSGEVVLDLFAGVGPFSILAAKRNPGVKVYAVDINPEAVELLKKNIRINRVETRVFPMLGDAKEIVANKLTRVADRVIMNLPETAMQFIDIACQAVKPSGGIIHFYAFIRLPDTIDALKLRFSEAVQKSSRKVDSFLHAKSIRETAPYESQVVLDAKISGQLELP